MDVSALWKLREEGNTTWLSSPEHGGLESKFPPVLRCHWAEKPSLLS